MDIGAISGARWPEEAHVSRRLPPVLFLSLFIACKGQDVAFSLLPERSTWTESIVDEETDTELDTTTSDCPTEAPPPLWLSSDDSNSMSAAQRARDLALDGHTPPLPSRTWEFLNYYSFDYEPAGPDLLALNLQLAADPDLAEGEYRLQIGVTSEQRDVSVRQSMNIALSFDTSGSMGGAPLARMKDACTAIAASLRAGDVVSAVTWNTSNNTMLSGHTASGPSDALVVTLCNTLSANGGTDLHAGLTAAYDLAQQHYTPDRVNRVVLISDGGANVGVTDADIIGGGAGALDEDGIYLVGIGVGTASSYNDHLMDTVTDLGRGASMFIGSTEEADKMLRARFAEVMDVAAREVEVRLDLPVGFEVVQFSGEELSTDRAEIEPQHLAPNDSMVFFQHIQACDPAAVTDDTPLTVTVIWKDDETFEPNELEVSTTFGALLGQPVRQLRRGAALYAYAEALRTGTPEALQAAYDRLVEADAEYPGDGELAEIRSVLDRL